ncbi:ATP-binding cassette domain-containing protein [Desulfomarina sp.]
MQKITTELFPKSETVLWAEGISKTFAGKKTATTEALQNISLHCTKGRVTGLVGADGAGKTTLLRIAAGLLIPTSGEMKIFGRDSTNESLEIQSRMGYMPQKFGLYQDLSVEENMNLYADLQGVPGAERPDRYAQLLTMTDLADYTERRAGDLSGGMKQKLGLACALIKSPDLLLLDEPTVGVDPISRRELWKIIYELVEKDAISVLVSTAYLDEAEQCDHVIVLHQGKLLAEGTPDHFINLMKGRVFFVTPPENASRRSSFTGLAGSHGIVDATIRSGRIRIVTGNVVNPGSNAIPTDISGEIEPVEPTFEDAFMAIIPRAQTSFHIEQNKKNMKKTVYADERPVHVENLCRLFGTFEAVKNLNFSVERGEIFGLLGPNGAGKSTTFRMLCGLLPASSGTIRVAGHDLRKSRANARVHLGYMAQQFSLYGQLSSHENLLFFGKAYGLSGKRLKKRIDWAFHEFELDRWRDRAAFSLPGGYKQRLAMAAALLHEPEILFLDEPTSGVDPFARREFWLRINGFAEQGVTVVVTTHFMEEAEYCDRMLIMSEGKTLAMGSPNDIRNLARSPQNNQPTMDDAFIELAERARENRV